MNPSNAKLNFSCIFNIGRTTYVDFFPFYNSEGGTELNILRAIIHFKKYELLTHPVCELFLHLKARRARNFYWMNNFLSFLFTILAAIYVFASYGHWDGDDVYNITCYDINDTVSETTEVCHFQNACYTYYLNIPLMILSLLNLFLNFFKYMQDPSSILNLNHWRSVPEEYFHILTFAFICIDQICMPIKYHQLLGGLIAFYSCRTLMYTIARIPSIAIFIETIDHIKKSTLILILSYSPFFVGWIITFHVLLGGDKDNSFNDIGSTILKIFSMFLSEFSFDQSFQKYTKFYHVESVDETVYNIFVFIFYIWFMFEMCLILMNLTIGTAISNIQVWLIMSNVTYW